MKKRTKWVLLTIPLVIVLLLACGFGYMASNRINYLTLKESYIGCGPEEYPSITLYFDKKEAELYYSKSKERKIITLNDEKVKEYKKYFIKYWNEKRNIKYDKFLRNGEEHEGGIVKWMISIYKRGDIYKSIDGFHYYPKDWKEFIAETNKLLGDDYLSNDTEGLELK